MFSGLGHHAIVSSDQNQCKVNATGACNHGAHQFLVAGHVYKGNGVLAGHLHGRVTQLNGDAALFFFRQAVYIHARKRQHQTGFAMVNMTRCTDNHGRLKLQKLQGVGQILCVV